MIEFWAVIGLATIDETFYQRIITEIDAVIPPCTNFDGVAKVLQEYNFRLGRYEAGEIVRLFKKEATRRGIKLLQEEFWYHPTSGEIDPSCLTGSVISGFDENGVSYKHFSVIDVNGKETADYSPLP